MPSALVRIVTSDEEKYQQQQLQLEQELCNLRREYFLLDQERSRSQITGWKKLAKSSKVVNIFKAEYENLVNDLSVATASGKQKADDKQFDLLHDLLLQFNIYNYRVRTEKTYMKELEGQIRAVAKDVQALRKRQITDRQYEQHVHDVRQTLERLENELELQTTKFNVIVANNRTLRSNIDHLLWDRRNFMRAWKKLIDKLVQGKRIMLDLIEQASIAYDQREEWCSKLQLLRITGHRDLQQNLERMRSCNQQINNARKLEEFFNTKGQKRIMRDLEEKEKLKRAELKKRLREKMDHYHHLMDDIIMFAKEPEVEHIARKYHNREYDNFSHFLFVLDLIAEMETLNDRLGYLHLDIDEKRVLNDKRRDQQQERIDAMEEALEEATQMTRETEEDLEDVNANLGALMQGILSLFKMCHCKEDPLVKLLGDNTTIKHYNVLLYLQILERTVHEALICAGYKDRSTIGSKKDIKRRILSDDSINMRIYSIERIVPAHPCALCVQHEMVSDVIDTVQKVWTKKEVRERLNTRLQMADGTARIHRISKCQLPGARSAIQRRYQ